MLLIILSHFAHQSCKSGPRSVLGGFIPCWGIEKPLCPYILRKLDYLKQLHLKKKNPGSLQTQNFAKWLWLLAIFHKPLVYEVLWKIVKNHSYLTKFGIWSDPGKYFLFRIARPKILTKFWSPKIFCGVPKLPKF